MSETTREEYQDGETLKLIVSGKVTVESGTPILKLGSGHLLPLDDPKVQPWMVTFAVPADGLPRPGQIWVDNLGTEYFVQHDPASVREVRLLTATGSGWKNWKHVHQSRLGPLRLVRDTPASEAETAE